MKVSETCLEQTHSGPISIGTRKLGGLFGRVFCRMFHRSLSRPVRGKYRCWKCLREYEITW